ncbi:MAG TPA: FecR domain-containing protein [Ohtaekwangia sp.]|uniref:FecR family protein n=1 Tax=Ohtaekwangia sp. TaxID=2066019 RepID=UPI002F94D42D
MRKFFQRKRIFTSIILFLSAGIAIFLLGKYTEYRSYHVTFQEKHTLPGQQTIFTLSDGSIVELHNEATLRYPEEFKGFRREVYLQGEATFEIERDSLRPFTIHTHEFRTTGIGTSLNIKTTADIITVSVAKGIAHVEAGDNMQIVLPKEKISYSRITKKMIKANVDTTHEFASR